jgi:hypothetical protein
MLAMVFVMLSVGFNKARAQTTVPVVLSSWSGHDPNWETQTSWTVTLHNSTTNDDYTFYTSSTNFDGDAYHLGYVSPGTYTVTVNYYGSPWEEHFDWYINDQSAENVDMYSLNDYTLSTTITVNDTNYDPNNYGLNIFLYAY